MYGYNKEIGEGKKRMQYDVRFHCQFKYDGRFPWVEI